MRIAIFVEESRTNVHGYDEVNWHCSNCNHICSLPQQQEFSYCFHCGARVFRKFGGEQKIKKIVKNTNNKIKVGEGQE